MGSRRLYLSIDTLDDSLFTHNRRIQFIWTIIWGLNKIILTYVAVVRVFFIQIQLFGQPCDTTDRSSFFQLDSFIWNASSLLETNDLVAI